MVRECPESMYDLKDGGWLRSNAYSCVQGEWVGQKCGDFERKYFLDAPYVEAPLYYAVSTL